MTTRTLLRLLLAGLAAVAVLLGAGGVAQAHNELKASTPANGAIVEAVPHWATLTFEEEIGGPQDLTVRFHGRRLAIQRVAGDPTSARVDLTPALGSPRVLLAWSNIDAEDGHASSGTIFFEVRGTTGGAASVGTPPAGRSGPDAVALDRWSVLSHVIGYLAAAIFLGGLLFVALLWNEGADERRTRAMLGGAVAAGLLAALLGLWVDVERLPSTSLGDVLISDYARATTGLLLFWVLAAVVLTGLLREGSGAVRATAWRVGAVVVAIGLIRTTGMTAHATQAATPWLGAVADFLHLTGVSAWLGGLLVMSIGLLPRRDLGRLATVVPSYSKVALTAVAAIVASGLVMLYQLAKPIEDFWSTHYAHVLLVKLALFAVVIVAAMGSKRWVDRSLDHAVATGNTASAHSFATSVAVEAVLAIGVLAAASVLVTSSPGA
ncbi:MAG TPA: CopD family protein [Nocardioides sp.]|nr:CopD family protein [Nocardioides sp.]